MDEIAMSPVNFDHLETGGDRAFSRDREGGLQ
jgi:hypothetical protein